MDQETARRDRGGFLRFDGTAVSVDPKQDRRDHDEQLIAKNTEGMDRTSMINAIAKSDPTFRSDGKSDDYLRARAGFAIENLSKNGARTHRADADRAAGGHQVQRLDANDSPNPFGRVIQQSVRADQARFAQSYGERPAALIPTDPSQLGNVMTQSKTADAGRFDASYGRAPMQRHDLDNAQGGVLARIHSARDRILVLGDQGKIDEMARALETCVLALEQLSPPGDSTAPTFGPNDL